MKRFTVCLVGYLLFNLAGEAHADVKVFFTRMTVNDCNEIGTCDWKLSCALGNQQETEFFNMAEANTNEGIDINRTLSQREFPPVTVTCTAMEHDGGIGAEWEDVGRAQLEVSTTGPHLMRLNQRRDEGDVTVHFTVQQVTSSGQPLTSAPKGVVYGITLNDDLMWMRHDGRGDGSFVWAPAPNGGKQVGAGWDFKQVFSGGDGIIYGVTNAGDLMWMRHQGRSDGSFSWVATANGGKKVGVGWNFEHVFSGGDGIIYGVTHGGDLMWMRHEGRLDGSFRWAPTPNGGKKVGVGWNFKQLFPGGNGVIYGVTDTGDLMWMRHEGRLDGSFRWAPVPDGGKRVGIGWNLKHLFSGGDGIIYGVTETGDLMWMRHDGRNDGSFVWAPAPHGGKKVGSGWTRRAFKQIFPG